MRNACLWFVIPLAVLRLPRGLLQLRILLCQPTRPLCSVGVLHQPVGSQVQRERHGDRG